MSRKRNPSEDEKLRDLERKAEAGDREAAVRLFHAMKRLGRPWIFKEGDKVRLKCKGWMPPAKEGTIAEVIYTEELPGIADVKTVSRYIVVFAGSHWEYVVGGESYPDDQIELIG